MDPRLQLRVQRYGWDAAAPYYQDGWSAQLKPAQDALLEMAGLQSGQRVIETACGTGMLTFPAAKAVEPNGTVLATDLSDKMVEEVTRLAGTANISNVTFARMGAEALDADDNDYDIALCALGLMYVPDPRKALSEMARVTRPGGKVVATIWGERRNCGWADIFPIVDAQVASEVCPMFFASGAPGIFSADFRAAGLGDILEKRLSLRLEFSDGDTLADAVIFGGPVAMAVKRFSSEIRDQVRAEFMATVAQFKNDDGSYSISGEFVTVSGTVQE
jgi:SAM-dependent methyltransferase